MTPASLLCEQRVLPPIVTPNEQLLNVVSFRVHRGRPTQILPVPGPNTAAPRNAVAPVYRQHSSIDRMNIFPRLTLYWISKLSTHDLGINCVPPAVTTHSTKHSSIAELHTAFVRTWSTSQSHLSINLTVSYQREVRVSNSQDDKVMCSIWYSVAYGSCTLAPRPLPVFQYYTQNIGSSLGTRLLVMSFMSTRTSMLGL